MPEAAQIRSENLTEVHRLSQPQCCLLTNRFKTTKWPWGTMAAFISIILVLAVAL